MLCKIQIDNQSSFIFITIGYSQETCVGAKMRVIMYQCRKSRTRNSSRATKRYPGSAREPASGSDILMIHPPILMLLHFDRWLTRTVHGTAASQWWRNALLRLLMNKPHHLVPISLCQPQGLWSGVSSLVERCLFSGPLLINSGYTVWEKKDEGEGENTGEYILDWLRKRQIVKRTSSASAYERWIVTGIC